MRLDHVLHRSKLADPTIYKCIFACGFKCIPKFNTMSTDVVVGPLRMSEVRRISNFNGIRCARRSLFGPADHEENRKCIEQEMAKIEQEQRERWNFDFQRGCPLQGRYEWSRIDSVNTQVTLTARKVVPETDSTVSSREEHCDKIQTKITDFMRKRKQSVKPSNKTMIINTPKLKMRRTASS